MSTHTRVWAKFESDQFKQRFKRGEVIPIVFKNAPLGVFDSATKVGHILWDRDANFDDQVCSATELLIKKSVDIRARRARDTETAGNGGSIQGDLFGGRS